MADFRRWIFALALVALLAGLSVPASAQSNVSCTSAVTNSAPTVRSEGLAELVGDLVLYCTGGTPTPAGRPVPQYTITVFLNTNITSKVLGTQLVAFGNGQTSSLDEALLIIDEPNSINSPGVRCGPKGDFNGSGPTLTGFGGGGANICSATVTGTSPSSPATVPPFSTTGNAYPILNCGAVVGGAPAAPDGGPSGPGVCEIVAVQNPNAPAGTPAPEHTYDGTVAGGYYSGLNFPDACQTNLTTVSTGSVIVIGNITTGSNIITINTTTTSLWLGDSISGTGIPAAATITGINNLQQMSMSAAATATANNVSVTISGPIRGASGVGSNSITISFPGNPAWVGGNVNDLDSGAVSFDDIITGVNGTTITVQTPTVGSFNGDRLLITFTQSLGTIGTVGAPGFSCGRPNVFQGRLGALQNPNQYNAVTFWGVPLDPPGTAVGRTLRITNIRANANQLGVSSTFTTQQILMNVAINNGPVSGWGIGNLQQIVAYVNRGLNPAVAIAPSANASFGSFGQSGSPFFGSLGGGQGRTGLAPGVPVIGEFVQCISQNPDLFLGTTSPGFRTPGFLGVDPITGSATFVTNGVPLQGTFPGGFNCPGGGDCTVGSASADITPMVRFSEGFASSWKEKVISFTVGNSAGGIGQSGNATFNSTNVLGFACPNTYCYNGNRNYPLDIPQNVPGAAYNTETGFSYPSTVANLVGPPPPVNPPPGFGTPAPVSPNPNPNPFTDDWGGTANATGIGNAGRADQGTRLYLSFQNIPAGSSLWTPPVIYLFRQGVQHNGDPATLGPNPMTGQAQSQATGVMVLTTTDAAGAGAFLRTQAISPFQLSKVGASGLAVYEILYADPFSTEYADVPVILAFASNPGQNLPAPAPPNPNTSVTGGFAPFYTSAASTQPSPNSTFQTPTLPVPRFVPGQAFDFINIQKCSCNILFPFVANVLGYDTGIAIANASLDPGSTFGFFGTPQPGTIQFWYYGDMANGAAVPGPQTSSVVQPGHVLTYVLSSGSSQYGLDGRGAGLQGYIITQAQFQYCHAYAFVSAQGAGPTSPGVSEGYLGIVLDRDGLPRTLSLGENKAH